MDLRPRRVAHFQHLAKVGQRRVPLSQTAVQRAASMQQAFAIATVRYLGSQFLQGRGRVQAAQPGTVDIDSLASSAKRESQAGQVALRAEVEFQALPGVARWLE